MTSWCPFCAAMNSGVAPSFVARSTVRAVAPATSWCPLRRANSGVSPSFLARSTVARARGDARHDLVVPVLRRIEQRRAPVVRRQVERRARRSAPRDLVVPNLRR